MVVQHRIILSLLNQINELKIENRRLQAAKNIEHESHYDDVASEYEEAFFYEDGSDYNKWYLNQVQNAIDLKTSHKFVDIGGGTGSV
jgi:hypothetical protein